MTAERFPTLSPEYLALVEKHRAEYAKLSNAKLAKKVRHLARAAGRCYLLKNVDLMLAFRAVAVDIARERGLV